MQCLRCFYFLKKKAGKIKGLNRTSLQLGTLHTYPNSQSYQSFCGSHMLRRNIDEGSGPKVIKLLSCSTQLSMKFQRLIKTEIHVPTKKKCLALCLLDVVFIMLINVKMPMIVCILPFMSRINFMLS